MDIYLNGVRRSRVYTTDTRDWRHRELQGGF